MKAAKDQVWVFSKELEGESVGEGVTRTVKSYTDELMVVENSFKKGAVGVLHKHVHTQITYVLRGKFEFIYL